MSGGEIVQITCFLCQKSDNVKKFTVQTLKRCLDSMEIRKKHHLLYMDVVIPSELNESVGYHSRPCYANFTALGSEYKQQYNSVDANGTQGDYGPEESICVFCGHLFKQLKNRMYRLVETTQYSTMNSVKDFAMKENNLRLLQHINSCIDNNLPIKYHKACKNNYISSAVRRENQTDWHEKRDHYKIALNDLCVFIQHYIIQQGQYCFLRFLLDLFLHFLLQSYNNPEMDKESFNTRHIPAKIKKLFAGEIQFINKPLQKKLVAPINCNSEIHIRLLNDKDDMLRNALLHQEEEYYANGCFDESCLLPDAIPSQNVSLIKFIVQSRKEGSSRFKIRGDCTLLSLQDLKKRKEREQKNRAETLVTPDDIEKRKNDEQGLSSDPLDTTENIEKRKNDEQGLSSDPLDTTENIEIPIEEIKIEEIKIEETEILSEDDPGLDYGPSTSINSTLILPGTSSKNNFDFEEKIKSIKKEEVECAEDLPIAPIEFNVAGFSCMQLKPNKRKRSCSSDRAASASLVEDSQNTASDDDALDLTGKIIANKLRRFPKKVRIIAEKLLNDVLYLAELGNLNENSMIVTKHC